MTNEQMTPNRYGQWAEARKLMGRIQNTLAANGIVTVATYAKATHYYKQHASMFKATKTGVYAQHGKRWDCISLCTIVFHTPKGF